MLVDAQYSIIGISPPSEYTYWETPNRVVPVDFAKFPKRFKKLAYAELDENLMPIYRIAIYEDYVTRETVFINMYDQEMLRLSAEKGYDPFLWAKTQFQLSSDSELNDLQRIIYDPAHTALEITLLPELFYASYLEIDQEEQAMLEASMAMAPMSMMMSMPAVVTDLQMGINSLSNGTVEVEVAWPTGFSDTVEIYSASDLVAGDWQFAFTNITTSGSTNYVWVDSDTNQTQRFYITGNADIDEDGDGLASARERYLYKTRSDLFDTDGDGLGDGWEMGYGLLPLSITGINGALGDTDSDGFSNLEEQLNDTDPGSSNSGGDTGTVATIRYYYDEDDRLTDFYCGSEVAQKTILTASHNISEEVSAK